jgi:DNA-binding NtrC family response regulator/tetratricopeptide (TPR) repeat protein
MGLVADRFVVQDDGCSWDLATGSRVSLSIAAAGDPAEQRKWLLRCDVLHRLRHHAIAPLVDFGLLGVAQRFEAWQCGATWHGAGDEAIRAERAAAQFLEAIDLTPGGESPGPVHHGEAGAVIVPAGTAGFGTASTACRAGVADVATGVVMVDRAAVDAVAGALASATGSRPRTLVLWGAPGSGKRTSILMLARTARLNGLVPVEARFVEWVLARALCDRTLFIIDRGPGPPAWSALLTALLRSPRPHVHLHVGAEDVRGVDCVSLGRIPADSLAQAVRPRPISSRAEARIRRLAERAQGLPGRFVRDLWGLPAVDRRSRSPRLPHVAEQVAVYGGEPADTLTATAEADAAFAAHPAHQWAAPGELAALRRRLEAATTLLQAGRHAPGTRWLRQALGGLARRGAWADAAGGALRLATTLMRRGRAREAQVALDEARIFASRGQLDGVLVDVGVLRGDTWIDLARLDEGERVLSGVLAAARAASDFTRVASAAAGLARCLFWQGRYAEAMAAAEAVGPATAGLAARESVRLARTVARAAAAVGDPARAMAAIDTAKRAIAPNGDPGLDADLACSSAFVHLTVGDLDAVEQEATASLTAARAARLPMRALAARLLQLEAARRRHASSVRARVNALRRMATAMPPIVKARWELLDALVSADAAEGVVDRHAAASGLKALTLFGAPLRRGAGTSASPDPFVDEIVGLLLVCQAAEEEPAVLAKVCARVRQQLHAAAVGFVAPAVAGGGYEVVVCDGPRIDTELAERAVQAGITIGPYRQQERIHAAAVVQYGGAAVGSLCARWTLGSTHDLSRAAAVLSLAAAAAAPMLGALRLRHARAEASGPEALLGVSSVMNELRRSVERAAAAPFAVLIEGESGSGKELVARAIHRSSPRRGRSFCTLNCAALPDDLVEAELFGHARGSFTGAVVERPGMFEDADGGSLFLDEIGELSLRAQAKVLRVIQEGELRRVGENVARRVDVRIVSATNRDLRREVDAGRFRLDLLYRLDVVRIVVPPLRERREDVPLLVDRFWRDAIDRVGSRALLGSTTRAALTAYDWPGNVRELQNVLAALAVRCPKRGVVPPTALPAHLVGSPRPDVWRLDAARRAFEEGFVRAALVRMGGHRRRAAAELGVTRQGLNKLMSRLGIES